MNSLRISEIIKDIYKRAKLIEYVKSKFFPMIVIRHAAFADVLCLIILRKLGKIVSLAFKRRYLFMLL